jgi:hypothetical protein
MDIRNHIRRMTGKPEMEQMVHMEETAEMDAGADRITRCQRLPLLVLLIMRLQTEDQRKIPFDYNTGFDMRTMG